jgi:hypothetical protein
MYIFFLPTESVIVAHPVQGLGKNSIYTIFFTVGSRNSTKISNFKNKKMMTNELSSFDEFNGISSCLDNTIRFLSQQSKKMKTPIRFLSQLSKK